MAFNNEEMLKRLGKVQGQPEAKEETYHQKVARGINKITEGQTEIIMAAKTPDELKFSTELVGKIPSLAISTDEMRAEGVGKLSEGITDIMVRSVKTPEDEAKSIAVAQQAGRNLSIIANEAQTLREAGTNIGAGQ